MKLTTYLGDSMNTQLKEADLESIVSSHCTILLEHGGKSFFDVLRCLPHYFDNCYELFAVY